MMSPQRWECPALSISSSFRASLSIPKYFRIEIEINKGFSAALLLFPRRHTAGTLQPPTPTPAAPRHRHQGTSFPTSIPHPGVWCLTQSCFPHPLEQDPTSILTPPAFSFPNRSREQPLLPKPAARRAEPISLTCFGHNSTSPSAQQLKGSSWSSALPGHRGISTGTARLRACRHQNPAWHGHVERAAAPDADLCLYKLLVPSQMFAELGELARQRGAGL